MSEVQRFLSKIEFRSGSACWWWKARQVGSGYGGFYAGGRNIRAHRWAYERWRGTIPAGLQLDHLCRNRLCVRPAHLEIVTNRVNVLRGIGPTAQNARKTHCPQGHQYSGSNLYVSPEGWRCCRACHSARSLRRYYRLRPDSGASSPLLATSTGTVRRSLGKEAHSQATRRA